jgi:hypothetical protein
MKSFQVITVLLLFILLCACNKKKNTATPTDVTINVESPIYGATYHNGDSVQITAAVSYNGILHGYEVLVTDSSTGAVIHNVANHIHTSSFNIHTAFAVNAATPLVLKLVINTQIDHSGENVNKIVYFSCNP